MPKGFEYEIWDLLGKNAKYLIELGWRLAKSDEVKGATASCLIICAEEDCGTEILSKIDFFSSFTICLQETEGCIG